MPRCSTSSLTRRTQRAKVATLRALHPLLNARRSLLQHAVRLDDLFLVPAHHEPAHCVVRGLVSRGRIHRSAKNLPIHVLHGFLPCGLK